MRTRPLKDDPQAIAAAKLLELQAADIGYRIARGAYETVGAPGAATQSSPQDLAKLVRDTQSTLALVGNKIGESRTGGSEAPPDEDFIALVESLGDMRQSLDEYAAAAAELETAAWRTGFVDPAQRSQDQRDALARMAEAAAMLDRVDAAVRKDVVAAQSQGEPPLPGRYRQLALRLQVLATAYRAALLPHLVHQLPHEDWALIAWKLLGYEQALEALPQAEALERLSSVTQEKLAHAATYMEQTATKASEELGGSGSREQLASLMGTDKGLVFMRGAAADGDVPDSATAEVRQFSNVLDYFWQASLLSSRAAKPALLERIHQALDDSFGPLSVTDVAPSSDGQSIGFTIAARGGVLALKGTVPTTPANVAADKEVLEKSTPVIVFRQEGDRLALAGLVMEGERVAYVRHQVLVPVQFAAGPAQQWKSRLDEREAAERLAAEQQQRKAEEQAAKAYAEREKALLQDPVYRQTNAYIAEMRALPPCVAIAQMMRNMASSQAPAHVREMQVEAMMDKIPEICVQ